MTLQEAIQQIKADKDKYRADAARNAAVQEGLDIALYTLSLVETGVINDESDIETLALSVRAYNCLRRHGVKTVGQLCAMTEEELCKVWNLGRKCVDEVIQKLDNYGLRVSEVTE